LATLLIFLLADILYNKVPHLKVSVLLRQFLVFFSDYTVLGERTVSQICRGQQISSRTGTVTETEDTEYFSGDAQLWDTETIPY
jgi:hypothetical protein